MGFRDHILLRAPALDMNPSANLHHLMQEGLGLLVEGPASCF
jgi:hypothetical protein